jgi:hypothetical protein
MHQSEGIELSISEGLDSIRIFERLDDAPKETIKDIYNELEPFLSRMTKDYPAFTPHGLKHVFQVLENLDRLLQEKIDDLSQAQKKVLILATLVHDVGMIPKLFEDDPENYDEDWVDHVRETHHKRSEKFAMESQMLASIDDSLKRAIGKVAKGHRKVTLFSSEYKSAGIVDDLDFLAAALRLADELDMTKERVAYINAHPRKKRFLDSLSEEAKIHWHKHLSIENWNPSEGGEVIEVHGVVRSELGQRGVELLHENLAETIRGIRNIDYHGERILPISHYIELRFHGIASRKYKVEIDADPVLDYLIDSLYGHKTVALREVVQNAIDACSLRAMPSEVYNPQIRIELKDNKLYVTDNGQGMTLPIIENYLIVLGMSFYKSDDFKKFLKYVDFEPTIIGRYGIGIFSVFLMSDAFLVRTRFRPRSPDRDTKWLETRFTRAFCPTFEVDPPEGTFEYGTQVVSELKLGTFENPKSDIRRYLEKILVRPRVDVFMGRDSTRPITQWPLEGDWGGLSEPKIISRKNNIRVFTEDENGVFLGVNIWPHERERRAWRVSHDCRCSISIEGILLNTGRLRTKYSYSLLTVIGALLFDEKVSAKFEFVVDFPEGMLTPTLNRTEVLEGENTVKRGFKNTEVLLEGLLRWIHLQYSQEANIDYFWRVTLEDGNYRKRTVEMLGIDEAIEYSSLVRGHKKASMKELKNSSKKEFNVADLIPWNIDMRSGGRKEFGWRPKDSPKFAREILLPTLANSGWDIIVPKLCNRATIEDWIHQEFNQISHLLNDENVQNLVRTIAWKETDFTPGAVLSFGSLLIERYLPEFESELFSIAPENAHAARILLRYEVHQNDNQKVEKIMEFSESWDELDRAKALWLMGEKEECEVILQSIAAKMRDRWALRSLARDEEIRAIAAESSAVSSLFPEPKSQSEVYVDVLEGYASINRYSIDRLS